MRRSIVGPILIVTALAAAGCEAVEDDPSSAPADTAREVTEVTEVPSTQTTLPTEQIGSCVERVQFGAYTGDTFWTQVWNDVGQSVVGAESFCSQLATDDPVGLLSIHNEWGEAEAFLAAAEPAPAAEEPAPAPAEPVAAATANGCDPNYSGCVPIASDVDCAGGVGDGPEYVTGPIKVLGDDIYGLDNDGDGTGC
jgi:hypothetical protein